MKKKISFLLCAAMLLTILAGCGGDNLTGTWEASLDVSETIGGSMVETMTQSMPDLAEYIDLSGLTIVIKTTFNEDGTYVSTVDEESFTAMMNTAASKAAAGFTEYLTKTIADLKLDIDIKDIVGLEEGETIEDRLKAEFNTEEFKEIIANSSQNGVYEAKDGCLFTAETTEDFNFEKYETYVLSENTLEITGSVGMEDDVVSVMTKTYPMTYKKIG